MIVFEPFYENYGPDAILSGATPRFVPLRPPDWTFDPDELAAAFNDRTKAIIVNTPNNPTGKVFTREELEPIAALCRSGTCSRSPTRSTSTSSTTAARTCRCDARRHGASARSTISGMSKTYSVTGWRVGLGDRAAGAHRRRSARCTTS